MGRLHGGFLPVSWFLSSEVSVDHFSIVVRQQSFRNIVGKYCRLCTRPTWYPRTSRVLRNQVENAMVDFFQTSTVGDPLKSSPAAVRRFAGDVCISKRTGAKGRGKERPGRQNLGQLYLQRSLGRGERVRESEISRGKFIREFGPRPWFENPLAAHRAFISRDNPSCC